MGKLKRKLETAQRSFEVAEAQANKQTDKVLAKVLANKKIGKKRARKYFESREELNRYSAKVEHLEYKLAKKLEKKAARGKASEAEDAKLDGSFDAAFAEKAEKERKAAELSDFAYKPTRGSIPNPSNPYSDEDYEFFKGKLAERVKPSRFEHSLAVSETAAKMAEAYGVNVPQARMAGLLHDWDKALGHENLVRRVTDFALDIDADVVAGMPWVLHGPTGAAVLHAQYPVLRSAVFDAIERHTVGAPGMSKLDMIVLCADKLEPGHKVDVYRALYDQIGAMPLEDLFFQVLKEGLVYVLDSGRPLSRDSIVVWNWYIEQLM